jgi:surface protein
MTNYIINEGNNPNYSRNGGVLSKTNPAYLVGTGIHYARNVLDPNPDTTEFIFTVDTTIASQTNSTSVTVPALGTYDIDWGNGDVDLAVTGTQIKDYGVGNGGQYTIKLSNTFTGLRYSGANDDLKLLSIVQFGTAAWSGGLSGGFFGCSNMDVVATDHLIVSGVLNFANFLRNCTSLTNFDLTGFDTSSTTALNNFADGCTLLDLDASILDITSLTNASNMLVNSGFSDANYDLLLVAWEGQAELAGVSFHAGTAKYSAGAPATARAALISNTWTITDGGPV